MANTARALDSVENAKCGIERIKVTDDALVRVVLKIFLRINRRASLNVMEK